ncbi:hypothetical protein GA0070606_2515 [Micromonospora citrea]|uniref:Uncharacterized protein n=1 Tax=Micromonospora citrea TaxID=47855 RepID=A0A1C6UPB3_9ACTN|nr:hypothetical protein GA0070606_2515 [Micromonospora citrea]
MLAAGVLLAPPLEPFELVEDEDDDEAVEPFDEPESPDEDESDFAGLVAPVFLPVSAPEERESVR